LKVAKEIIIKTSFDGKTRRSKIIWFSEMKIYRSVFWDNNESW
jgi:hypothetical protein